jgi:tetratricopeptide (TPR) repeat protein
MGKTNLLLHMKRRREAHNDIVLYVDLSERFESARACFRHIVDVALETRPTILASAAAVIREQRAGDVPEAAVEYGRHLREILRAAGSSKIIVILDEVDSLVSVSYSDAILAQIRSTYFTRSNFPEYDRLTYVLSGVIEPTDLIKDKNISPFNIGEKIYLDDFSFDEVEEFLRKAGLRLTFPVVERIYSWTMGNPRITWDVCAAIEEMQISGLMVEPRNVDDVVDRLYLINFDKPPIDHIRVLVAGDAHLRNALISIRYGKGDTIDEKIRSKLYLAGITNASFNKPSIKNPIIDASLSDSWLAQATSLGESSLLRAAEHFVGGRYNLVVEALLQHRRGEGEPLSANYLMYLGISFYSTGEYPLAIDELKLSLLTIKGEARTTAQYYLASSLILSDRTEEALVVLEEAGGAGSGPHLLPSRILLVAAYYRLESGALELRVRELRAELSEAIDGDSSPQQLDRPEAIASALYSLALAAIAADDVDNAVGFLEQTRKISPLGMLPAILMTLHSITADPNRRAILAREAKDLVVEHALIASQAVGEIAYNDKILAAIYLALNESDDKRDLEELVEFNASSEPHERSKLEIVLDIIEPVADIDGQRVREFLRYLSEKAALENLVAGVRGTVRLFRMLVLHTAGEENDLARAHYVSALEMLPHGTKVSDVDLIFIITAVQQFTNNSNYDRALPLIKTARPFFYLGDDVFWLLILISSEMMIYNVNGDIVSAKKVAEEIIDISGDSLPEDLGSPELNEFKLNMVEQAHKTLAKREHVEPDLYRHIGRNQKVVISEDGHEEQRTVKFKFVEQGVRSGRFNLVRVLPR